MSSVKYHISDDVTITRTATATTTVTVTVPVPVTIPVSHSTSRRWSAGTIVPIQTKAEDMEHQHQHQHQLKHQLKHQHVEMHVNEGSGSGSGSGSRCPIVIASPAPLKATSASPAIHIQSTTARTAATAEKAEVSITSHSKSHSNSNSNSNSDSTVVDIDVKQKLRKHAQWYHIWALGVSSSISASFVGWNLTLVYGFGPALLTLVLIGIGYATMIYSYSELTACIPFSGGSFGFVRATMGIIPALLIGVAESLEYILAVCVSVMQLAQMITMLTGLNVKYEILWYFLISSFALAVHIRGGRVLWNSILASAVMGILCLIIYWITCWQYSNISFTTNARLKLPLEEGSPERETWFIGAAEGFFKVFPLGIWWYLGIESVPLAAEETFRPRESIPRGANRAIGTMLIVTFVTLITAVSMPPSIMNLSTAAFGLSPALDVVWKLQGEGHSTFIRNS